MPGVEGSTQNRTGLVVGGYFSSAIMDKVFIQPELVYSQQGYKQHVNLGFFGTYTVEYRVDYINFPCMFKIYPSSGFHIDLGPQFGFVINKKGVVAGTTSDLENVSSFDVSIGLGLGYELENGLNFNARYYFGLTDVETDYDDLTLKIKSFNLVWAFILRRVEGGEFNP